MKTLATLLVASLMATQTFAMTLFLQNQWTKGSNRYCEYSGGYILTLQSIDLCPISIDR